MINIRKIIIHLYLNNEFVKNQLRSKNITIKNLQSYLDQKGGSIEEIKINYNNEDFVFIDTFGDLVYFLYSKDGKEDTCLSITIDSENKVAYINNINGDTLKCGDTIMDNQGSHLLKAGVKFLIENKKKFNINIIQLTDNAYINCYSKILNKNKQINLSELLLLTKGYTFYGKYKFEPLDKEYKKIEDKVIKKLKNLKIKDLQFDKIIKYIYEENKKYKNIKTKYIDKFKEYYEKYNNKDINYLDFMSNYFHKGNPNSCIIFNLMYGEFMRQIYKIYPKLIKMKYNIVRELKLQ
jgi:hypothetical protein